MIMFSSICQILPLFFTIPRSCLVKDYDVKVKTVSFLQVVVFGLAATWIFGITLVCKINLFAFAFLQFQLQWGWHELCHIESTSLF